ncbi:MAG TPA: FtsX-like permease family protein [Acidimicrobiales bacterium]|nr:FtsX-like permease family protein [Acidimicrobiales bacterium]
MITQALRVARFRLPSTVARSRGGYLAIVLLIGLIGGIAMASVAAGRRTQSSYPIFLASTNPTDMSAAVFEPGGSNGAPSLINEIRRLPGVRHVSDEVGPNVVPLTARGTPRTSGLDSVAIIGSADGLGTHQDRLALVQGRLADPNRAGELVMNASAARQLGVHLGQVIPLGIYGGGQSAASPMGTRLRTLRGRLVGIFELNSQLVQDDIDSSYGFVELTPALVREALALSPVAPVLYGLQLTHPADVAAVEREITQIIPRGATTEFHVTARIVSEVELALKPESVALGAFGAIAALVCLVLGIQAISRQLRREDEDRQVLRAFGAAPGATGSDEVIGTLGAVVLGSLLAVGVAVALSPLAPLGPVRPVYPDPGVSADWTVLGVGLAVLVVVLGSVTVALSILGAPHRVARARRERSRSSAAARGADAAGLPIAAALGVRFALEPGRGRSATPVRSALFGAVLAITLVVTTLTFATSLGTLVSHPPLYGWNWSYLLNPSNTFPPYAQRLLNHDPDVAAWSGADYQNAEIQGQGVPILLTRAGAAVSPPILAGHGLEASNQIVLGAATAAEFHKHLGDTVTISYLSRQDAPLYIPPTRLKIVGIATLPAVGYVSFVADHTSMGIGAVVPLGLLPRAFRRALINPDPNENGPELAFVRLKAGVGAAAGRANLQHLAAAASKELAADPNTNTDNVTVLGVQRPAQIVNYRSIGSTPVVLAVGLAAGAIVALGLTLATSVRRRRRELALLKALGLAPRQLVAAVAWQATVAAAIGIVVGIPLGIVLGRQLWILFARNINAVPSPAVPALLVVLVGVGALLFANLVAILPGRAAGRASTAPLLRTE